MLIGYKRSKLLQNITKLTKPSMSFQQDIEGATFWRALYIMNSY